VDIVLEIHEAAIERFGGTPGVREMALVESAVTAPQAGFSGKSHYKDVVEIAAAYLFYLCKNHAYLDGNKRTALGACIVFLRLNEVEVKSDGPEWEKLVLAVASSEIDREETTAKLRKLLEDPRQHNGENFKPVMP
jgi:death-on-curing protein